MRKRSLISMLMVMIILGGCGRPAAAPARAPGTEGTPPPAAEAPGPATSAPAATGQAAQPAAPVQVPAAGSPTPSPLPGDPPPPSIVARRTWTLDQLRTELEQYLNAAGAATAKERILALEQSWGIHPADDGRLARMPYAEADLDGDGGTELVVALSTYGEWQTVPTGTVFVIRRAANGYRVDRGDSPPRDVAAVDGTSLLGTADLTGDGKPEIIWVAEDHGAHTAVDYVYVSQWAPGKVTTLSGTLSTSFAGVRIDGQDLVLHGGVVGSAGAGLTQRASIDRYRWTDGAFRLIDREYDPSEWAYHRLVDGINAETFGHMEKAEAAYRSAIELDRKVLPDEQVPPEWRERFVQAVHAFARFRRALLLWRHGQEAEAKKVLAVTGGAYAGLTAAVAPAASPDAGCQAATAWARDHAEFLDALNSPYGYHNFQWSPTDLCGELPRDMK